MPTLIPINTLVATHENADFVDSGVNTVTKTILLKGGTNYLKYSGIGLATSGGDSGKCKLLDAANSDGSQNPFGILIEAIDATQDVYVTVWIKGKFNSDKMVFASGSANTASAFRAGFRDAGLYIEPFVNNTQATI